MTIDEARVAGNKSFNGTIHKRCGTNERYVSNKQCVYCNQERLRNPATMAPYRATSKLRSKANRRVWRQRNRDKILAKYSSDKRRQYYDADQTYWRSIQRLYNISKAEYTSLLNSQCGGCAICGKQEKRLAVDHDHVTSKIRGLLCGTCNRGISMFNEDINVVERAVQYLQVDIFVTI